MKKKEILKTLAILVIPGSIPVWLSYKIYQHIKSKGKVNDKDNSDVQSNTSSDN